MQSLRVKILATAAILILASQAGTVAVVLFTAKADVAERAEQSMQAGTELLGNATASRADQLANTVRALAADYGFKQAVGMGETATVSSALQNHANRAGADIAFIVDRQQQLLATFTSQGQLSGDKADLAGVTFAAAGHRFFITDDSAFEIITVPVKAPLPIAWLSMGFELNNGFTQQLEKLTGLEVTLLAASETTQRVLASSKKSAPVEDLRHAGTNVSVSDAVQTVQIDGQDHLAITTPFFGRESGINVLITKSLQETMAPYELLKTASFALGALPLAAALFGAVLLSRALTRPVSRLMEAAQRIRAGNYEVPVEIRSGDELHEFGTAFNAMQSEIAQREKHISHQSRHDAATGLYNREYALELLGDMVDGAWDQGQTVGLLVVRLDALKDLNSTLGHEPADEYLSEVARRLRRFAGDNYLLARLENDDFMLALTEDDTVQIRDIAEDLRNQLGTSLRLPSVNVNIEPVIGMAVFPKHANNARNLLLRATIAVNDAVQEGRPDRFYREGDQEQRVRNLNLLQDLKSAAADNELKMYLQPKIDLSSETVCGAEALVRWQHSRYGLLQPAAFIPVVERAGDMLIITRWMIAEAGKQLAAWAAQGKDLSLAINLSANDLMDDELPWFIMDTVKHNSLDPSRLIVEVTEEAMIEDFAKATSTLVRIHDLGITVSIDDFGTGYSSLAQLKNLPAQELKIDRAFIANLPGDDADVAIVSACIDLARKLNLKTVAEGVSDGQALRWLQAHAVDRAQGFYWSEPLSADAFADWLLNFDGGATVQTKPLKLV